MTIAARGVESALAMLARDGEDTAVRVERLRTAVASGALPQGVEWTVDQGDGGQVRLGVLNRATRGVVWVTGWF